MMSPTPDARTPNERLAEIIAAALTGAGLIPPTRLDELKRKLAYGTAKAEDWCHWIESTQRNTRRKEQGDE
ncbi:MAG: hypothetical protein ABI977_38105 [Acidobacteriota bacterium]